MTERIKAICMSEKSRSPYDIVIKLMKLDGTPMHGPVHHCIDGAAFLTAMHNAGAQFDLASALDELFERGKKMPGATCGQWGICGASASLGAALAVINKTGPLSNNEYYKDNMRLTSRILGRMAEIGGPRCCKRNAFISINEAIDFANESYGFELEKKGIVCNFYPENKQCIGERCPYSPQ